MVNIEHKISPSKILVALWLFGSLLAFSTFFFTHIERSTDLPPAITFPFMLYGLSFEWRTVYLCKDAIYIHYHPVFFCKRKIPLTRSFHIEYACDKYQRFVLITLDRCPPFSKSKYKKLKSYIYGHPFKVIAIRCTETSKDRWETYFDKLL